MPPSFKSRPLSSWSNSLGKWRWDRVLLNLALQRGRGDCQLAALSYWNLFQKRFLGGLEQWDGGTVSWIWCICLLRRGGEAMGKAWRGVSLSNFCQMKIEFHPLSDGSDATFIRWTLSFILSQMEVWLQRGLGERWKLGRMQTAWPGLWAGKVE